MIGEIIKNHNNQILVTSLSPSHQLIHYSQDQRISYSLIDTPAGLIMNRISPITHAICLALGLSASLLPSAAGAAPLPDSVIKVDGGVQDYEINTTEDLTGFKHRSASRLLETHRPSSTAHLSRSKRLTMAFILKAQAFKLPIRTLSFLSPLKQTIQTRRLTAAPLPSIFRAPARQTSTQTRLPFIPNTQNWHLQAFTA